MDITNNQLPTRPKGRLNEDIAASIRANYNPETHGVIYNMSGHAIPYNFIKEVIKAEGIRTFSKFECAFHLEDDDLWGECQRVVEVIGSYTCPIVERNSYECPGKRFVFLPTNANAAALLILAISKILVIPPYLVRVRYDSREGDFRVESIVNLKDWGSAIRSYRGRRYTGVSVGVIEAPAAPVSKSDLASAKVIKLRK